MKRIVSKACNLLKVSSSLNPKSFGLLRRRLFFTTKLLKACRNEKHSFSVEHSLLVPVSMPSLLVNSKKKCLFIGGPELGNLILRAVQDNSHDVLM